jgi:hypothetical protein
MVKSAPSTIVLKGRGIRKEAVAAAAVTPGHLIMLNSAGKYAVHNVAGGRTTPLFAVENELEGKEISDAYAADDQLFAEAVPSGAEIYALVAAAAAAIAVGDLLESAGDGTLRKAIDLTAAAGTPVTTGIIADVGGSPSQATINNGFATVAALVSFPGAMFRALEAVDNSGGGTAARIKVEVI